jgi:hypothetical protein
LKLQQERVRAIAENKEGKLLLGTFANVELPLDIIEDAISTEAGYSCTKREEDFLF